MSFWISFNRKLVVWGEVDISGDVSADNFDSEKIKQVQAFCERENAVLITGDDLTPINQTDFDWRKIKNLSQLESELTSIAS